MGTSNLNAKKLHIAVLDDWQGVAQGLPIWKALESHAQVTFFSSPFASEDEAAERLRPFQILVAMRERTPFPETLLRRLPNLRLFALTGHRGAKLDIQAMHAAGITVCYTDGAGGNQTAELALGLILAAARRIPQGDAAVRAGRFQEGVPPGFGLSGKVLGLVGVGRVGTFVAGYGQALGMKVLAWSPNLTPERAAAAGAQAVSKRTLLETSDVVSLHLVASAATYRVIGEDEIASMKPGALLVNTSRAGLIDHSALLAALKAHRIIAALDVYETEPLALDDPIRHAPNCVLTPHLGYASIDNFSAHYEQCVENITAYLRGAPIRVIAPTPHPTRRPDADIN